MTLRNAYIIIYRSLINVNHKLYMTKILRQLIESKTKADRVISGMSFAQKKQLEKAWDTEHAYYSSALEGSRLDRERFDVLAQKEK